MTWAIITHAVRITCVYEERAQGLLCSVHQARRAHVSAFQSLFNGLCKPLWKD